MSVSTSPAREAVGASGSGFQIPSLDGLRALSFGLVFFAHSGMSLGIAFPGGFGVTVFFFLSGYLITTLLRREFAKNGTISFRKFYLRRVLRILPNFYLVLIAALVVSYSLGQLHTLKISGVIAQALHYSNYWIVANTFDGLPAGTGVFWSLAVEEHFYLIFPLAFLALMHTGAKPERLAIILLTTCGLLLLWRIYIALQFDHSDPMVQQRLEIASDARFDSLLYGCLLALYGNPALDTTRIAESTWKYVLLPLSLFGLLISFLYRDEFFRGTFRYTLQGLCLISVFVCAVRYSTWTPMKLLNLRPVAFIGVLSYSLYLVHQIVLVVVNHALSGWSPNSQGICALMLSLLIAWIIHLAVEQPFSRLRHRLRA